MKSESSSGDGPSAMAKTRFLWVPILFTCAVMALAVAPHRVLPSVPSISFGWAKASTRTAADALGVFPTTRTEAFTFGRLVERLVAAQASGDEAGVAAALAAVSEVAGRKVTVGEALAIEANTQGLDSGRGALSRALGMLTLVNLVWLVSIMGIAGFILPALYVCMAPLARLIVQIFTDIIVPLFIKLRPVFEVVFFAIDFLIIAEGLRMPADTGVMVCLTGLALAVPAYAHSVHLHAPGGGDMEAFVAVSGLLFSTWTLPFAFHFGDALMAWIGVASFYAALGFSILPFGLCWAIGFSSREAMPRIMATSALLLVLFSCARGFGIEPKFVRVLTGPVSVLGTLTLFLAQLITSSKLYSQFSSEAYMLRQIVMIVTLSAAVAAGAILALPGIYNTGLTFGALYGSEKILELPVLWKGSMPPVTILCISIALYVSSLFLASHPGWLGSVAFNL